MTLLFSVLVVFSALSFIGYGIVCLTSDYMQKEFERFHLEEFAILTGMLELLGGAGMLVGLYTGTLWLLAFSSGGLSLLMLFGIGFRMRAKDSLLNTLPAILFMLLNAGLCLLAAL